MKLLQIILVTIVLSIYGLINYFIGYKGYKAFKIIPFFNSKVYWFIFTVIVLSIFIVKLLENRFEGHFYNKLEILSYIWMASIVYILLILLLYDIVGFLLRITTLSFYKLWIRPDVSLIRAVFTILILMVIFIYGNINSKNIKVVDYDIKIKKRVENLTELNVVMASDFHLGNIINDKRLEYFVETTNKLKPDLILLAGDIIDENPKVYDRLNMKDIFSRLESKYGVYACLGNHEYFRGNTSEIVKSLSEGKIRVLRDEVVNIEDAFYIIGREDKIFNRLIDKRKSIDELIKDLDKNKPIILLDHQPTEIESAIEKGVDIEFSGHTHKGQFFPIDLFTKRIFIKDYGHYSKGKYNLIVTSGYGTWGPPIRIGNSPEIVFVKIKFNG